MEFPRVEKFILEFSPLLFIRKFPTAAPCSDATPPRGESTIIVPELPANNKRRSQPLGVDHVHRGKHTLRTHSGPLHGTTRLINFLCNLTTRSAAKTTKIMQRPIETFSAFSPLHRARYFCLPSFHFSSPSRIRHRLLSPGGNSKVRVRVFHACFYATRSFREN